MTQAGDGHTGISSLGKALGPSGQQTEPEPDVQTGSKCSQQHCGLYEQKHGHQIMSDYPPLFSTC